MKTAGMKCSAFRLRAFKYAYVNQEEKAHARTLYWLKAPTSAFRFKTLLIHYDKQTITFVSSSRPETREQVCSSPWCQP